MTTLRGTLLRWWQRPSPLLTRMLGQWLATVTSSIPMEGSINSDSLLKYRERPSCDFHGIPALGFTSPPASFLETLGSSEDHCHWICAIAWIRHSSSNLLSGSVFSCCPS